MSCNAVKLFSIMMLYIAIAVANPVMADTDYHCLSTCHSAGVSSDACMTQCTFQPDVGASQTNLPPKKASAKQFDAPKPQDRLILKQKPVEKKDANENYLCISQCLKQNMQYGLCEKTCKPQ